MKSRMMTLAAAILAASFVVTHAGASDPTSQSKTRPSARKKTASAAPSVEEQIQALRQELQSQIDSLKNQLAERDAELRRAQQSAARAQAAAARAQAAAEAQQQAVNQNQAAVSVLQGAVGDLKGSQASLAAGVSADTASLKKSIAAPEALRYKGTTISLAGSFVAAETVWRSGATSSDVSTPFTYIPLQHSQAAQMTELQASARQSRIALKATGRLSNMTLAGYYEIDWMAAAATSTSNQSNGYAMRQRQIWLDAALDNGWDFSAGHGWSLATETTRGLARGSEIMPSVIDGQYVAGFVWTRQYGFRVSKNIGKSLFLGASVENPQTLSPAGQNLPDNVLLGSAGNASGTYNPSANYSFNLAPDLIAKIAAEPGWGHWELFGIGRFFRDRIYPATGAPYNDAVFGGGIGGGFRGPLFDKKLSIGLKGLYGDGVGRYGSSTIADITLRPDGAISPLHGFSALGSVDLNPTPRLNLYFNYGGDYIGRDWALDSSSQQVGYGAYTADMSGCGIEPASTSATGNAVGVTPGNSTNKCLADNKDLQEFTAGYWFYFYKGSKGALRQGIQYSNIRRDLWSGNGGALNPGGGAHGNDNMVFTSFRYCLP